MKWAFAILLAVVSTLANAATISMGGMLEFIVYIVIISLIFWVVWWFIGYVGVPEPFNKVIRVVLGLFALIIVINLLMSMVGTPLFRIN